MGALIEVAGDPMKAINSAVSSFTGNTQKGGRGAGRGAIAAPPVRVTRRKYATSRWWLAIGTVLATRW
jgi:hypothetical protein